LLILIIDDSEFVIAHFEHAECESGVVIGSVMALVAAFYVTCVYEVKKRRYDGQALRSKCGKGIPIIFVLIQEMVDEFQFALPCHVLRIQVNDFVHEISCLFADASGGMPKQGDINAALLWLELRNRLVFVVLRHAAIL